MDDTNRKGQAQPEQSFEQDEEEEGSGDSPNVKVKKHRRRGVIFCKHGCGFKYEPPSSRGEKKNPNDRKLRDQFDYHEQQKCPLLPRLVCPLECKYRGKVLSFAGPKALRQHLKTKAHREAQEALGVEVDMKPKIESDYDPSIIHGNPKHSGFRKKVDDSDVEDVAPPSKLESKSKKAKVVPSEDFSKLESFADDSAGERERKQEEERLAARAARVALLAAFASQELQHEDVSSSNSSEPLALEGQEKTFALNSVRNLLKRVFVAQHHQDSTTSSNVC